jgi:putative transcriptional regulator
MTLHHHPDETLLLAYAAGRLDSPMTLIVATHLSFCVQCRSAVSVGEKIGGILMEDIAPEALADGALTRIMARLDEPVSVAPTQERPSVDNTPAPLRAFLGRDLRDVRWRKMGPRLSYVTLYRQGGLAMRLLRGAPGAETGSHSHRGSEYTLVLQGGYSDETGHYAPGDFQAATDAVTHNPVADPGPDCINLAVTTDRLRFSGTTQGFLAALLGF